MRFSYSQGSDGLAITLTGAFAAAPFFAAFFAAPFLGAAVSSSATAGLLFGQNKNTPDFSVFSSR